MLNTDSLQITNEMLLLITEIDEFKGAWRALGTLAPDRLSALRRIATIESVGSSTRIEGSKLSDRDVERLLLNLEMTSFQTRDEQEVAGYATVMEVIFEHYNDMTITENIVKQLHRDLLQFSTKDERHRGEYKTLSNCVEAFDENGNSVGIIFETASPFDTPARMNELFGWFDNSIQNKSLHPLLIISIFVVVFLAIHPFQDGNGRLSRVLTTLALLRAGYSYVPYYSMESIVEQNKESYYLALRRTQGSINKSNPDWLPWTIFFLTMMQKQKSKLKIKLDREELLVAQLPDIALKIVDIAKQHGKVTVNDAVIIIGTNRNTIKDHFKFLVKNGYLILHGAGRGSWYSVK